jgi:hypothetical protein
VLTLKVEAARQVLLRCAPASERCTERATVERRANITDSTADYEILIAKQVRAWVENTRLTKTRPKEVLYLA